jgi:hypothetical protein
VANNYGYTGPGAMNDGRTTAPGIELVDLNRSGRGCHSVWRSREIVPSAVPTLSLASRRHTGSLVRDRG